jgi:ParB family chromosome partitioning protein
MPKNYAKNAEDRSVFLVPSNSDSDAIKKGDRTDTSPFRAARMIDIDRIHPDPNQPRKTFVQETLESLAASIEEVGGIIDPLTVEYAENDDCFRIISGERRYRAAKIIGLDRLPCIVKEVNDKTRFIMQFIANLQREDIPPLEEAAGIKQLTMENFSHTQKNIGKLINKSKSYISQILGLDRLSKPAREIVQTSELSKEILIQASREKDPEKQVGILKSASNGNKTVRQLREKQKNNQPSLFDDKSGSDKPVENKEKNITKALKNDTFSEWLWKPKDENDEIIIRFSDAQRCDRKLNLIQEALKEAYKNFTDSEIHGST